MHHRACTLLACCPYLSAMVTYNLLNNRQTYSTAALRRISGGIRPVKAVKNILHILLCYTLSVVLYLKLYKVIRIAYPYIDMPFLSVDMYLTELLMMLFITLLSCSGSAIITAALSA